jgi:hypothetical protein
MFNISFFKFITFISIISVLAPIVCCILRVKALNNILRALFIYLLICFAAEITGVLLAINHITNNITQNLFTILEGSFIVYVYYFKFESLKSKGIITALYLVFLFISIIMFFKKGLNNQDSIASTFEAVFIICLSVCYFYKLIDELNVTRLNRYYFSWINSGFLIYFSMALVMSIFDSFLEKCNLPTYRSLFSLHLISNIILNILLATGIWKIKS